MAPKKQNNRTKLTLAQALEKLGYNPDSDVPYSFKKPRSMYDPYDQGNASVRERTLDRNSYPVRKPDSIYTEKFKELTDFSNLNRVYSNMPMYDGVSKKEKNRKKLAEALSRHIGKILPF